MKAALVSVEDRRFYEHQGVDWKGTIRAADQQPVRRRHAGRLHAHPAVRQELPDQRRLPGQQGRQEKAQEQTIARKLREARIALQLEQKMTKDEILTGYLNVVEFSDRVFGIGAAAKAYFGTTADKLNVQQSALLSGMVNNPVALDPWKHPTGRAAAPQPGDRQDGGEPEALAGRGHRGKEEPLGVPKSVRKPVSTCVGAGPQYGFYCQYVVDYLRRSASATTSSRPAATRSRPA